MGEDDVVDCGVGHVGGHGQLDYGEEFADARPDCGEAQDAVFRGDEDFHEASGFVEGAAAEGSGHGDLAKTVGSSLLPGFIFCQAYMGYFGVGEGDGRHLAALGGAVGSGEVGLG